MFEVDDIVPGKVARNEYLHSVAKQARERLDGPQIMSVRDFPIRRPGNWYSYSGPALVPGRIRNRTQDQFVTTADIHRKPDMGHGLL